MKLLIVSAHLDDETLGAGGLILKTKSDPENKVFWLNFTDMSEEYGYAKDLVLKRMQELKQVLQAYNIDGFYNLKLKPTVLDTYSKNELIEKVSKIFKEISPDVIVLPYNNDVHSDHRVVFDVTYPCTKIFRYSTIKKILMSEIISETDFVMSDIGFVPNYFVDITKYIDKKIEIMKIYKSEIKSHPFPRSEENIRALALTRGSTSGCEYAEAFRLLKMID